MTDLNELTANSDTSQPTQAKLLCIEDDPTVVAAIRRFLSRDFNVLSASDANEANKLLDEHPDVAVVLADHRLPGGVSGLSLLATVRTKAPDAVRAILSGQIDLKEMVEAINSSLLHRFILKPWDNEYFRIQMLEALANHSTLREKRQLEKLSVTDSLTGLKNHRYFHDRLRVEVERALRHSRPLSLAIIDIDHFKNVNDSHGHQIGDLILQSAAIRFLDQVRQLDTVARYGGEEFAVLMPDTGFDSAFKVAERIRKAVSNQPFIFPNHSPISINVSIGVASVPENARTPQDLIRAADQALYQAKSRGRNQTVGAD